MSAQEIIEQLKTLPCEEQKLVADFLDGMVGAAKTPAREIPPERWAAIIEGVFDEHDELFRRLAP